MAFQVKRTFNPTLHSMWVMATPPPSAALIYGFFGEKKTSSFFFPPPLIHSVKLAIH
jgi:hypothetical protein